MSQQLVQTLFQELESYSLIDPHSHINPLSAASRNLADILGYHYYTELAHSAGLPQELIEETDLSPKEKVGRLVEKLADLDNTIQLSWLIEICREFFDFKDESINANNWEALYDHSEAKMASADWEEHVLRHSRLDRVVLTNEFDDPLAGFDTQRYLPCLRTDDLVFQLSSQSVRERLQRASGQSLQPVNDLRSAIGQLFEFFQSRNAVACAISLPSSFSPERVTTEEITPIWERVLRNESLDHDSQNRLAQFVFWTLAEFCDQFALPFDLMIGVSRKVYPAGVFQGQDLYDSRVSLIQYRELFNAFPKVKFPVSVLTHMSNQELVSYSWIFPNVIAHGHWWYSNIPTYIELDTRARLEAIPRTKQIGYYSDMYKLEFALPKFRMYRKVLARVLAVDFVQNRSWSEQQALQLGHQILRQNVETIFNIRG